MADKMQPGRFTLKFNLSDPQQLAAVNILNRMGRQKAQFVARALIHYTECTDMTLMSTPAPMDEHTLEQAILNVLSKYSSVESLQSLVIHDERNDPPELLQPKQIEPTPSTPDSDNTIPDESLSAISKTMKAFWHQ